MIDAQVQEYHYRNTSRETGFKCFRCDKINDRPAPSVTRGQAVEVACEHCGWANNITFMLARWHHVVKVN